MSSARITLTPHGFRRAFIASSMLAGAGLAVTFSAFPHIDIATSEAMRALCDGDARHLGWCHENGVLSIPRHLAMLSSVAFCLITVGMAAGAVRKWGWRRTAQRDCALFMLAAFILGPGFLANLVLKDNWGRARPREIVEFGGSRAFTPPLSTAHECEDNCSFVSGEAAAAFTPFFAAAMAFPHIQITLATCGVVAGTAVGLLRVSTGGHFLSDVLFAGIFMALLVAGLHVFLFPMHRRDSGARRPAAPATLGIR